MIERLTVMRDTFYLVGQCLVLRKKGATYYCQVGETKEGLLARLSEFGRDFKLVEVKNVPASLMAHLEKFHPEFCSG